MKEPKDEDGGSDKNVVKGKCDRFGQEGSGGGSVAGVKEGGRADEDALEQQQVHHRHFIAQSARALLK